MGLTVSIIVATFNGAHKIPNLIKGLLVQWRDEFDLIIVIDGSLDNTAEVIELFRPYFQNLKLINQMNKGRSLARNRGAKEAKGELLIFYDDDMVPAEDSIQKHIQFHEQRSGLICGNSVEREEVSKTDVQNYKAFLTKKWTRKYVDGINELHREHLFFTAANSSVRKATFDFLGGFNERLSDAEDNDLAFRALEGNIPVYFDKGNKALHQESITCVSYIRRLRAYGIAHKKIKLLYPDRFQTSPRITGNFVKTMVYRIFAFPFWAKCVDSQILKYILPKSLRYKLYDIIIESLSVRYPSIPI